jgi:hypothetical protein
MSTDHARSSGTDGSPAESSQRFTPQHLASQLLIICLSQQAPIGSETKDESEIRLRRLASVASKDEFVEVSLKLGFAHWANEPHRATDRLCGLVCLATAKYFSMRLQILLITFELSPPSNAL